MNKAGAKSMDLTLEQLIGHGHFFDRTFLRADAFVKYCSDRGLRVTLENLEQFERLGLFLPLIRIRWPRIKIKVAAKEDGAGHEDLGVLEDGEEWNGETREKDGGFFWWDSEAIRWLISKELLWIPSQRRFEPWSTYRRDDGWWKVHSYYSIFQTLPLEKYLESTTIKLGLETLAEWSMEDAIKWFQQWQKHAEWLVFASRDEHAYDAAILCQALSSRYLPYAQSDGATITIPHPKFFDWPKFRREWKAVDYIKALGIDTEVIGHCWQSVISQRAYLDPLHNWRDLVDFIRSSQKERLRGHALLCQTWATMAKMLNLFHRDLTGAANYEFDDAPEDKELFYGKGVLNNDIRFLEFLSNRYGLNPRPKLILVVEGDGEEQEFPRLAESLLPPSFSRLRIAVMNIKGIGEMGKLTRLIDHYHSLQTIVFATLDNENNSKALRSTIARTASLWNPKKSITKEEYIHIWHTNVEFDNFTDEELAQSMTATSEGRVEFTPEDIAICRHKFGQGRDPLSALFEERLNYGLPKRTLLKLLFDIAIERPEMECNEERTPRPILDVITSVQRLALRNHQPSHLDAWQQTQDSDWLRNFLP
jgi:hypothetical protein